MAVVEGSAAMETSVAAAMEVGHTADMEDPMMGPVALGVATDLEAMVEDSEDHMMGWDLVVTVEGHQAASEATVADMAQTLDMATVPVASVWAVEAALMVDMADLLVVSETAGETLVATMVMETLVAEAATETRLMGATPLAGRDRRAPMENVGAAKSKAAHVANVLII